MYYEGEVEMLNKRVQAVLRYIDEHPKSDPNAYEMMDLTIKVGNLSAKIRNTAMEEKADEFFGFEYVSKYEALKTLRKNYFDMMEIRLKGLKKLCDKKDPLYEMFEGKLDVVMQYIGFAYNEDRISFMCKLAGVSLYTKQRIKYLVDSGKFNDEVIYDNKKEFFYLMDKYNILALRADPEIKIIRKVFGGIMKCYKKYV